MELDIVIPGEIVQYKGVFSVAELYHVIDEWLVERNYIRIEKKHYESTTKTGKTIELHLAPEKKFSDYVIGALDIKIFITGMKDKKVLNIPKKLNEGSVKIELKAVLKTDYEGRWESTPLNQLIKAIYDKFIYPGMNQKFRDRLKEDALHLKNEIKGLLNLAKRRY